MRAQLDRLYRACERLVPARDCEVWEAPFDRGVYFMVAGRLTRRQALDTAALLAAAQPHPPAVLVVDGLGTPLYQTSPAASARPGPQPAGAGAADAATRARADGETFVPGAYGRTGLRVLNA